MNPRLNDELSTKNKIEWLRETATTIGGHFGGQVAAISGVLLDDPRFSSWSGSSKDYQHHYGDGGLLQHTFEVVRLQLITARFLQLEPIDQ